MIYTIIIILLGFFIGIFYSIKAINIFPNPIIKDILFKKLICKEINLFVYFLFKSVFLFLITFILFLFSFTKIRYFICYLVIISFSFCFGLSCVYAYFYYSCFIGIIFCIIVFVLEMLLLTVMAFFSLTYSKFNKQFALYGNCSIRNYELKILLFCFLILVLILLIEIILIFIMQKIFIFI